MNWIRKTVLFVSLLVITFFASQANEFDVQNNETQKTDTNFSIASADASAFIQPQENYQFAANIKTNHSNLIKWFDSLLVGIPQHKEVKSASNFANQFSSQRKKILLLLYPFHNFW